MSGGPGSLRREHAMPTMLIELPSVAMRSASIPPTARPRSKDRNASPVEGHPPSPHDTSYRCTHGDTLTARTTALSEINDRFRVMVESSVSGIYFFQDDLFRYVNPALARMFGYAVE